MTRSQFRLLVVLNQLLIIATIPVQEISDQALLPQLRTGSSVFDQQGLPPLSDIPYWVGTAVIVIGFVAAIGLFFGKRWGRTLYLLVAVAALMSSFLTEVYVNTSWTGFMSYLVGATEGMILGLAYFSHIKRMFEPHDTQLDTDEGHTLNNRPHDVRLL